MSDGPDLEIRQRCLLVGSRIGLDIHEIAGAALDVFQYTGGPATEDPKRIQERLHVRDIQRGILRDRYADLTEAVEAARKSCGWYDDSRVGHDVDRLLSVGPNADPEDIFNELGELTRDLYEVETNAIRDAKRGP